MRRRLVAMLGVALVTAAVCGVAVAQDRPSPPGRSAPPRPEGPVAGSGQAARDRTLIPWFATLESARVEAKRTDRAILLLSAAPQCRGISGVW